VKIAIVLTFDIREPDDVPAIIRRIDPPRLPGFDGELRVVLDEHAAELIAWTDER
jgi:hypothetical protein